MDTASLDCRGVPSATCGIWGNSLCLGHIAIITGIGEEDSTNHFVALSIKNLIKKASVLSSLLGSILHHLESSEWATVLGNRNLALKLDAKSN